MEWLLAVVITWAVAATVYIVYLRNVREVDLDAIAALNKESSEKHSLAKEMDEELQSIRLDLKGAYLDNSEWHKKYSEINRLYHNVLDEKEQSIGNQHEVVFLGDGDQYVAYYHGELVVNPQRLSVIAYNDGTFRFEVTYGNKGDDDGYDDVVYLD